MFNEEKILQTINLIQDTCLIDLNNIEAAFTMLNVLLMVAEKFLPNGLEKDAKALLSNGKRVKYELLKHEDNFGLQIALKVHMLLSELNDQIEGYKE